MVGSVRQIKYSFDEPIPPFFLMIQAHSSRRLIEIFVLKQNFIVEIAETIS